MFLKEERKKSEKSPKSTGHARSVFIIERTPMLRPFKFIHKKISEWKYNQYLITYGYAYRNANL
jgi:hypothetical protein